MYLLTPLTHFYLPTLPLPHFWLFQKERKRREKKGKKKRRKRKRRKGRKKGKKERKKEGKEGRKVGEKRGLHCRGREPPNHQRSQLVRTYLEEWSLLVHSLTSARDRFDTPNDCEYFLLLKTEQKIPQLHLIENLCP